MPVAASIVWELRPTTGAADNGGGANSVTVATDYSQQAAPHLAIDNVLVTATTPGAGSNTLTITAGYAVDGSEVGNVIAITGGVNINPGLYEILVAMVFPVNQFTVQGALNLTTGGGAGAAVTGN